MQNHNYNIKIIKSNKKHHKIVSFQVKFLKNEGHLSFRRCFLLSFFFVYLLNFIYNMKNQSILKNRINIDEPEKCLTMYLVFFVGNLIFSLDFPS